MTLVNGNVKGRSSSLHGNLLTDEGRTSSFIENQLNLCTCRCTLTEIEASMHRSSHEGEGICMDNETNRQKMLKIFFRQLRAAKILLEEGLDAVSVVDFSLRRVL